ncbi:MAG: heme ABC transporter ATP-binding protein [Chloroflexi bacterium]|nr:heme ABC transporter ATP-binding protein [Chloroflexota bacterium]MBI5290275.1 heme ABC transporter ATP-binding protein [Chloroflexota bacterium]
MSTLKLSNLSASYGTRPVLRGVTLGVAGGEALALVGPNGAGKSTLIRAISGVVPARGGEVWLDDVNLLTLSPSERAKRVAVVPQMIHLPDAFTVGEIVLMGRTPHLPLWAAESRRDCEIAWQAMKRTQIESLAERRAHELSGGEQQRAVIARALAQEPRVLLLDEPTAHLDLRHQIATLELIQSLAKDSGLVVLMTLHDLNQAAIYADRVALMSQGEIVAQGSAAEVFTAGQLSKVYGVRVALAAHPVHGTPLVAPIANGGHE